MVSTPLKNISQIGNLPQIGGENKKSLKPRPSILRPKTNLNLNLHLPPWNLWPGSHRILTWRMRWFFSHKWHLVATKLTNWATKSTGLKGRTDFCSIVFLWDFWSHPTVSPSISPSLPEILTLLVVLNLPIFQVHHQRRVSPSSVPKLDHV